MASPTAESRDIDLISIEGPFPRSADACPSPIAFVDPPVRARHYHSIQLAVVTGLFACGGFLCSLFFVDGGDDFPQPHHWVRKSYTLPVVIPPPAPPGHRIVRHNVPLRPSPEPKITTLQKHQVANRKLAASPSRTDRANFDFQPVTELRTKWTELSGNLRDRAVLLATARNRALDFGRRLRQHYFEAGKASVRGETDIHTDDAG
jgi:hypothetical protein